MVDLVFDEGEAIALEVWVVTGVLDRDVGALDGFETDELAGGPTEAVDDDLEGLGVLTIEVSDHAQGVDLVGVLVNGGRDELGVDVVDFFQGFTRLSEGAEVREWVAAVEGDALGWLGLEHAWERGLRGF